MESLGKAIIATKNGEERGTLVYKRKAAPYKDDSENDVRVEGEELPDNNKEN